MQKNKRLQFFPVLLILAFLIASCEGSGTSTPLPSASTMTPVTVANDTTESEGAPFTIWQGGYAFAAPEASNVFVQGSDVILSTSESDLFLLNGRWDFSRDLDAESILKTLLNTFFREGQNNVETSEPTAINVDGVDGIACDFHGQYSSKSVQGRALVLKPSKTRYVFLFGMTHTQDEIDAWQETGSKIFDRIVKSLSILDDEQGKDAFICPVSPDPSYGFLIENPIHIGGESQYGLMRERAYLDNLLGINGEPMKYEYVGPVQSPNTIVDEYRLTINDQELTLYFDVYSYGPITTPQNLACLGRFPVTEP